MYAVTFWCAWSAFRSGAWVRSGYHLRHAQLVCRVVTGRVEEGGASDPVRIRDCCSAACLPAAKRSQRACSNDARQARRAGDLQAEYLPVCGTVKGAGAADGSYLVFARLKRPCLQHKRRTSERAARCPRERCRHRFQQHHRTPRMHMQRAAKLALATGPQE